MEDKNRIKPAKLKFDAKEKTAALNVEKNSNEHDYAMEAKEQLKRDREDNSSPPTPSKEPCEKKKKPKSNNEDDTEDVSNKRILEAVLGLERRVEAQLADLKEQAKQSSVMIANLAKAVQFNAEEVKECQQKVNDLKKQNDQLCKDNDQMKERMREQERYRMRWCLRIKGMKENQDENIREEVIKILSKVTPEMESIMENAVDVVHRMGKKMDNKTRNVIILFAKRHVKEEIWRRTKKSQVCKDIGIQFAEMLPREDWEEREKLWPQIEQARKEGKVAYFRGPQGFINGRRIFVGN